MQSNSYETGFFLNNPITNPKLFEGKPPSKKYEVLLGLFIYISYQLI
jgi:hypothetical protein